MAQTKVPQGSVMHPLVGFSDGNIDFSQMRRTLFDDLLEYSHKFVIVKKSVFGFEGGEVAVGEGRPE
jgi:hypothetical protein